MLTNAIVQPKYLPMQAAPALDPELEEFAERRRIALLESDAPLRAVIVRALLRVGCVVTFKRRCAQIIAALRMDELQGVVLALPIDESQAELLIEANIHHVPIVVLMNAPPLPQLARRAPNLRFLQKPFDMRELFTQLHLPHEAKIIRRDKCL